jgi:hypothetical protein
MVEPSARPAAARPSVAPTATPQAQRIQQGVDASISAAGRIRANKLTAADKHNIAALSEDFLGVCKGDVDVWAAKHHLDPRVVPVLKSAVKSAEEDGVDAFSPARLGQTMKDIFDAMSQPGVPKQANPGVARLTKAEKKRLKRNRQRV